MTKTLGMTLALLVTAAAPGATFVVDGSSPEAADTNPGTSQKPFKTITAGAKVAKPGDTVEVRAGIYRETVLLSVAGQKDKPVTLKAAAGERVVVTGADVLLGWRKVTREEAQGNPNWEKLYTLDLDWVPQRLTDGAKDYRLSRMPEEGWWQPTKTEGARVLYDTKNLTQADAKAWNGWTLAALNSAAGRIIRHTDFVFDPQQHKITLARDWSGAGAIDPQRDAYYLENHVSGLKGPMQYALQTRGTGSRVILWPGKVGAEGPAVEAVRRENAINTRGAKFVVIDGLELRHVTGQLIGRNEPLSDSVIQNCYLHDAGSYGIGAMAERLTIRRCIIRRVSHGIVFHSCKDSTIEENDIGWCLTDGLDGANGIRGLVIARNYIHDHFRFSHPDNIQFWTDCSDITIRDNVMMNGGQTMMSSGVRKLKILGNVFCGSHAVSMIVGGESGSNRRLTAEERAKAVAAAASDEIEIIGNTICATGLLPTSLQGKGITFKGNVVAPLHPIPLYGMQDVKTFVSDFNLLWNQGAGGRPLVVIGAWADSAATIEEIRQKTGQEKHGVVGDPKFANAPKAFLVTDYKRLSQCTKTRLVTGRVDGRVSAGDVVEIGFDGVPRKAVEVGADYVVFDKPLDSVPEFPHSIANWGTQTDLKWDLRLKDGSPGKKAAEDGGDIGSRLSIQDYIRGDFDGDGKRDLPDLPED